MSNMEDRKLSLKESQALDARYQAARAEIERSRKVEAGQGAALMFAAMAYRDELYGQSAYQTAVHAAKLVCIAALFIVPNLLVLRVLF